MEASEIKEGKTYSSNRWRGDRKVTKIVRVTNPAIPIRDQVAVVHYIDLRTMRTGNAPLPLFSSIASGPGAVTNV